MLLLCKEFSAFWQPVYRRQTHVHQLSAVLVAGTCPTTGPYSRGRANVSSSCGYSCPGAYERYHHPTHLLRLEHPASRGPQRGWLLCLGLELPPDRRPQTFFPLFSPVVHVPVAAGFFWWSPSYPSGSSVSSLELKISLFPLWVSRPRPVGGT